MEIEQAYDVRSMTKNEFWTMIIKEHVELLLTLVSDNEIIIRLTQVRNSIGSSSTGHCFAITHEILSYLTQLLDRGERISNHLLPVTEFEILVEHILKETVFYLQGETKPREFWTDEVLEHSRMILRHLTDENRRSFLTSVIEGLESHSVDFGDAVRALEDLCADEEIDQLLRRMILHEFKETIYAQRFLIEHVN